MWCLKKRPGLTRICSTFFKVCICNITSNFLFLFQSFISEEIYNDTFNDYLMRFYNTLFTECFIYGSISANTAHIIAYRITHYLNNNRLKKTCSTGVELVRMRDINILPGKTLALNNPLFLPALFNL